MIERFLNFYFKFPVILDFVVSTLICITMATLTYNEIGWEFDRKRLTSINSDLISTSISLAGFVLAALTIIVTFKDNVKKGEQDSGKTVFFNSSRYFDLVKVFYGAALELLFIFILLTITKISDLFSFMGIEAYIILASLIIICSAVFRSLILLFQIIKLQKAN